MREKMPCSNILQYANETAAIHAYHPPFRSGQPTRDRQTSASLLVCATILVGSLHHRRWRRARPKPVLGRRSCGVTFAVKLPTSITVQSQLNCDSLAAPKL